MTATSKPVILLSNDDGYLAPGILALRDRLAEFAQVYVVAPRTERSAASHSISLHHPIRIEHIDETTHAVDGTPVDSLLIGLDRILPVQPDWIVSGINRGGNLGSDVFYSGTVGVALEGAIQGVKSMAVSLEPRKDSPEMFYETAAELVARLLQSSSAEQLPRNCIYNLNVPSVPIDTCKGIKSAALGKRVYESRYITCTDPRGHDYYWLGVDVQAEEDQNCDAWFVENGYASLSILEAKLDTRDQGPILDELIDQMQEG